MVRARCFVVVRHVTRFACRIVQRVVVVDVARLAGHVDVRARQRKPSRCMIESRSAPTRCVVARQTGCRESCSDMRGAIRIVVVRFVASVAVGRQRRVVVMYVARAASHAHVRAGQRKGRLAVIECCRLPRPRVVTNSASRGNATLPVIWAGGAVVVLDVA